MYIESKHDDLSEAQRQMLEVVREFIATHERSPSLSEMAFNYSVKVPRKGKNGKLKTVAKNFAVKMRDQLVSLGYLAYEPFEQNSIRLTAKAKRNHKNNKKEKP